MPNQRNNFASYPKILKEINLNVLWTKPRTKKIFFMLQRDDMLTFATIRGFEFLVRSKNILEDGTLKTAPNRFFKFKSVSDPVKIRKYRLSGVSHAKK